MRRRTELTTMNPKFGRESKLMDEKTPVDTGLNRREFLKGAVAGSAALATGLPQVLDAEGAHSKSRPYAELRSLPPGAVKPEGWLKMHAEGQARLASALPEITY